ncbi:MAG: acyl-CoA synthetase [Actinocatenispora sp.]
MPDVRSSTVGDVVRRSRARHPHRVAVRFADRSWTYAELDDAASAAAVELLALGLRHGDRVAAYGRNSDAYLIAFLGCARAGLVHVPVNYSLTGTELAYLLAQSGSTALLFDPALEPAVDAAARADTSGNGEDGGGKDGEDAATGRLGRLCRLALRDAPGSLLERVTGADVTAPDVEVADEDLAQLLYTSGTTSRPKGAMMTHRALVHEYLSCIQALDLTAADEPLHVMPLYHSAQMHVFLLPYLAVGATNHLVEAPEAGDILRRIEADRHGAFFAAPTLWVAIANHADLATRELGSLRKAFYGASIMPGPVLERLRTALPDLGFYNSFGQSEIGPLATVLRPEQHADRPASAGRSVLFVEFRVVDAEGVDVAPGELGEIVYRSPQLTTGYWDKPEETAEAFRDGWFHSGDLVRVDDEGYIFVIDRIKDVINTGGVLVASREVEDALYTHPAVAEVAVIGTPDPKWIEVITAVVVLKEPAEPTELIDHVRGRIAGFKVPKRVHVVDELPRNASGKLLKRLLRQDLAPDQP